jgi:hypothetical protein
MASEDVMFFLKAKTFSFRFLGVPRAERVFPALAAAQRRRSPTVGRGASVRSEISIGTTLLTRSRTTTSELFWERRAIGIGGAGELDFAHGDR